MFQRMIKYFKSADQALMGLPVWMTSLCAVLCLWSCGKGGVQVNFHINGQDRPASDNQPSISDPGSFYIVQPGDTLIVVDKSEPQKKVTERNWNTGEQFYQPLQSDLSAIALVAERPSDIIRIRLCVDRQELNCATKWIYVRDGFDVPPPISQDKTTVGGKEGGGGNIELPPVITGIPQLELDGRIASISGISGGDYTVRYKVNGVAMEANVRFRSTRGSWPLVLAADKLNIVSVESVRRSADGSMSRVDLVQTFGIEQDYRKGHFDIGYRRIPDIEDCSGLNWVKSGSYTIRSKGPASVEYVYIYLAEKGRVEFSISEGGGQRKIERELLRGENKVSLLDLYPDIPQGESVRLMVKGLTTQLADLRQCGSELPKSTSVELEYGREGAVVANIRIRVD